MNAAEKTTLLSRVKRFFIRDESEHKIFNSIKKITFPAFLELLLSSLFNIIDVAMVGQLSSEAMSGVGLTNQPFFLFTAIFSAINVGTTTLVAWAIGSKNTKRCSLIVRQALMFNLVVGILFSCAAFFFAEPIMRFMTDEASKNAITPEQIESYQLMLKYAVQYFEIIGIGIVFTACTLAISASLRGEGQTRIPMTYNIAANGINVALNFLLIYGHMGLPALGVRGAAIATTTSRGIAFISALTVLYVMKNLKVRLKLRDSWKPNFSLIKDIFAIGMPSAGEQFVIQGGLTFFSRILSGLGAAAYSAHLIVQNVNSVSFSISQAFSVSATALVGQAVGADDYGLAAKIALLSRRYARAVTSCVALLFVIFGYYIAILFTASDDPNRLSIAANAAPIFVIAAITQFIQSSQMSTAAALRGSGDTMYPLYASMFGILFCRLSLAYLFVIVLNFGIIGGWLAFLIDQMVRSFIVKRRFDSGKWKAMRAKKEAASLKRRQKYGNAE